MQGDENKKKQLKIKNITKDVPKTSEHCLKFSKIFQ